MFYIFKINISRICSALIHMSRVMRKPFFFFIYAKTRTQISFAVTVKLISAFVFATRIIQSLFFVNPKFIASSHLVWLYSPVYVRPGRKPRRPVFSQQGSYDREGLASLCVLCHMSHFARKPLFWVSNQVRLKPHCTENG